MMALQRQSLWPVLSWPYRAGRGFVSIVLDRALGVHTTETGIEFARSGERPPGFVHRPWSWLGLWRIFKFLEVAKSDVLLDVGSGSGRALLVASRFPFRRLIGVEHSQLLQLIAAGNMRSFRLGPINNVELVQDDILNVGLPDGVTIIYFYNSFGGDQFKKFITQLLASIDHRPRHLRFVYCNPVEHDHLMSTGRFKLTARFRGWRPGQHWSRMLSTHFYEVVPASGRSSQG